MQNPDMKPALETSSSGMDERKLISLIIPVFNEEENINPLYAAVIRIIEPVKERFRFEFIFTDNHSTDKTFETLGALAAKDRRIRVFRFSRNFGYQRSIVTGYRLARGDAAIQLDCDMQDPPEMITDFIEQWQQGHHVVYGVRRSRKEGLLINSLRKIFYRIISLLSEDPLPVDAGDFRLIDRCVLNELLQMEDSQPYLRGAIAALGFSQVGIPYDRAERKFGTSKFKLREYVSLSIDGVLNHSVVPLRIAMFCGFFVTIVTFFALLVYLFGRIFFGQSWPAGFATTTILILFSLSLNALFLGIIGEYLGRIYKQVKKKPITVIESKINA